MIVRRISDADGEHQDVLLIQIPMVVLVGILLVIILVGFAIGIGMILGGFA